MNTTDISTNNSTTVYNSSNGLTKYDKLVIIHGVLLSVPFLLVTPIAIGIVRFGKTRLPNFWFRLHWSLQLLIATPLVIGGFVIAHFIQNESNRIKNWALDPHSIFGHIAGIGFLLETVLGWIHHKLWKPDRGNVAWWTKLHRIWGYIVCFSAFISIGFGLRLYEVPVAWYITGCIWIVLLFFVFIFFSSNTSSKPQQESEQDAKE